MAPININLEVIKMVKKIHFDRNGFEVFRRVSDEYNKLLPLIKKYCIDKLLNKDNFLDVGAGNPTALTDPIAPYFKTIDVIEPDLFYRPLYKDKGYHIMGSTIQNSFLLENHYDLVLVSHVFYYIPYYEWKEVISKLITSLKNNGRLCFVLHSENSDIYRLMNELCREYKTSAEELERFILESLTSKPKSLHYSGKIRIETDEERRLIVQFLSHTAGTNYLKLKIFSDSLDNSGKLIVVKK